jgi:hypothetical protein
MFFKLQNLKQNKSLTMTKNVSNGIKLLRGFDKKIAENLNTTVGNSETRITAEYSQKL